MFHLKVVTPEEVLFDGEVVSFIAPGAEGFFGVLTDHAPLIAALKKGPLTISENDQQSKTFQISGGIAKVQNNQAYIIVDN